MTRIIYLHDLPLLSYLSNGDLEVPRYLICPVNDFCSLNHQEL